jgi:hypothetical protein
MNSDTILEFTTETLIYSNVTFYFFTTGHPSSVYRKKVLVNKEEKKISIKNGSVIKESDCLSNCVICLEEFKSDNKIREINHCKHSFHVKCIDEWFVKNNSCPVCRYNICKPSK